MDFKPAVSQGRVAAVDLGSNCFHLLIADTDRDQWHPLLRRRFRVGLAGGVCNGMLQQPVFARAEVALAEIAALLHAHACSRAHVVGTCAMRQLAGNNPLLQSVQRLLGEQARVISGAEEARLIYLGALQTLPEATGAPRLVIDIGGGSTEIAWGRGEQVEHCVSLPLGCIAISEAGLNLTDRGPAAVMDACLQAARSVVMRAPLEVFVEHCPASVIGTSGSAESICTVAGRGQVPAGVLVRPQLDQVFERLAGAPRLPLALPGLEPGRERVFPGSVAILAALWERLQFSELRWTEGALQDGLLCEALSSRP